MEKFRQYLSTFDLLQRLASLVLHNTMGESFKLSDSINAKPKYRRFVASVPGVRAPNMRREKLYF